MSLTRRSYLLCFFLQVKVPTRVGQIYVYDTLKGDQDEYDVPPRHQPPSQQDIYDVPPTRQQFSTQVKVPTRVGQIYVYDTLKGDQDEYDVPPRHQPPSQQDIYDVPPTRQQFSTQVYDTPPMVVKGPSSGQDIYDTPSGSDKNPQQTVYDTPPMVVKGPSSGQDIYDTPSGSDKNPQQTLFLNMRPPPPGQYLHNNMAADGDEDDEPPIPEDVLCPGDRHLLLFYQEQCEQNVTTVTNAIDAFFSAVGSNQPPKIFVAHGKFVILSAHKLVFIGDTLARQARSPEVKGRAAQSSNALCEKLKDVVVSTKMAALQYPAPGAAREMTERVRELAACTQQFRMALGQLLLM
ncbi:unnamed protein product [Menidia menidia]|uniref:(Atlantic silverside) hypothetical protein n=1 Tax=Menidia menidia TaxID=238744 RepID=A0A8S4BHX8_9TELE|nr:unnamed protein product [Menidia menidia]